MKQLWQIDVDTLELFYKILKEAKAQKGAPLLPEEKDFIFRGLMKRLNIKPIGSTEMTKDELIEDAIKKGHKNILDIQADGKVRIIKKKENKDDS